ISCQADIRHEPARPGDQRYTAADTTKLYRHLGWRPKIGLDEGLAQQVAWQRGNLRKVTQLQGTQGDDAPDASALGTRGGSDLLEKNLPFGRLPSCSSDSQTEIHSHAYEDLSSGWDAGTGN